jgi:hypothetical protein
MIFSDCKRIGNCKIFGRILGKSKKISKILEIVQFLGLG